MSDAAQVLAAHRPRWGERARIGCTCGWTSNDPVVMTDIALHEAHVLAVLSETHAVVELPKLTPDENGFVQWGAEGDDHVWTSQGTKRVRVYIDDPRFPAEGAQEFAAAVLAIARVAEGGGSRG